MVLAETATGASHLRKGEPGQDAVRAGIVDGCAAVALADGHGSAARAAAGADLAVDLALTILFELAGVMAEAEAGQVEAFAREVLRPRLVVRWREAILAAEGAEASLEPFGCTLLAALATPRWVLALQLGDGDLLRVSAGGEVDRPLPRDLRCFADETLSMCLPQAALDLRVAAWPRGDQEALLVLATDGYANSYADDAAFERIGPDWLDLLRRCGPGEVALRLPGILASTSAQGSGDDISLGLLHLNAPRAPRSPGDSP